VEEVLGRKVASRGPATSTGSDPEAAPDRGDRGVRGSYRLLPAHTKTATEAYGDVIQQCEGRGRSVAGNKIS